MPTDRIIAVTPTFNRKDFLLRHARAMAAQTRRPDALVIVDNASNDGTPEALLAQGWLSGESLPPPLGATELRTGEISGLPLRYVRMERNTGCAGGVAFGLSHAVREMAASWCWSMDDDCIPRPDALEKLAACLGRDDAVCLTSLPLDGEGRLMASHRSTFNPDKLYPGFTIPLPDERYVPGRVEEIGLSAFDGFLVRASALEKAGLPEARLHFFHEDHDFSCAWARWAGCSW